MAKKLGLLEKLSTVPPTKSWKYVTWFDRLAPELQQEVQAVKDSYLRGEQPFNAKSLATWLVETCKLPARPDTVARWLRSK